MEVKIEKLDHSGRGIAHINNKIVFIENALPGEIVDIEITKEKKNVLEAKVTNYIKESDKRIESLCPFYGECGGCDILHMSYKEQLAYKQNKVEEILARYAGVDNKVIQPIIPSEQFDYRNKVSLKVKGNIGYYKKESNDIVNIDSCLLASKDINETIKQLTLLENYDDLDEIIIRKIGTSDTSLTVNLRNAKNEYLILKELSKISNNVNLLQDYRPLHKRHKSNIIVSVDNLRYTISSTAFFQVNVDGMKKLYDKIRDYLIKEYKPNVLDLYCGIGAIGIYISDISNIILGIERNPKAIKDAEENAELNNARNMKFISGDVKTAIKQTDFRVDSIILDPPRAGLERELVDYIMEIQPEQIIYVSCDPMTLARDLKILNDMYEIKEITPVDMFPNTNHVEGVANLRLKKEL